MVAIHRPSLSERRTYLHAMGEALLSISKDEDTLQALVGALEKRDAQTFRKALRHVPLPDEPSACRDFCETIGYTREPGEWVRVCRWAATGEALDSPGKLTAKQKSQVQLLGNATTAAHVLQVLIAVGLIRCEMEYQEGDVEEVMWCSTTCAPERPPPPGPGPPPFEETA